MAYGTHEPIGRTIQLAAPMRVEDVVLRPMDGYPEIVTFRCSPLCADIQPSACKSNYLSQKSVSCRACPVGAKHAEVEVRTAVDVLNDSSVNAFERAAAKNSLCCTRCMKSSMTNERLQMGMRLVRFGTVCVSCYNREREILDGRNSKGMTPKKWAHLKPARILVSEKDKLKEMEIGLSTGLAETRRHAARRKLKLVKVWIDEVLVYEKKERTEAPSESSAPVADAIAPTTAHEPIVDAPAQPERDDELESEWALVAVCEGDSTRLVRDLAAAEGVTCVQYAAARGWIAEPEPETVAPAPEPVKAAHAPTPKKLTGKQLRKAEKRAAREARAANQPQQPAPVRMPAKQTAIAARAYALLQAAT